VVVAHLRTPGDFVVCSTVDDVEMATLLLRHESVHAQRRDENVATDELRASPRSSTSDSRFACASDRRREHALASSTEPANTGTLEAEVSTDLELAAGVDEQRSSDLRVAELPLLVRARAASGRARAVGLAPTVVMGSG
jgi:hypothetical protein